MLFLLWRRNIRSNAARYLLAVGGIGLAVLLVTVTMTGVSVIKSVGAKPLTQVVGGDIMVLSGSLDLKAKPGGLFSDLSNVKMFDPQELMGKLSDLEVTRSLIIPAYAYPNGRNQGTVIALLGREPIESRLFPRIYTGRILGEADVGLPRIFVPLGGYYMGLSTLRVRLPTSGDGPSSMDLAHGDDYELEVVGTTDEPFASTPFVPLSFLQRAVGTDEVLWLGVRVDDPTAVDRVAARIRQAAPGFSALTIEQILETVDVESANLQKAAATIIVLALVIGCLAVVNTLLMVIRLRRREVALMKAIGIGPRAIVTIFVAEALSAGFVGTMVGYLLGSLVGSALGRLGVVFSLNTLIYVVTVAMAVTLLSIVLPALWATRHSVLEVMRND